MVFRWILLNIPHQKTIKDYKLMLQFVFGSQEVSKEVDGCYNKIIRL